jgi:predicted MFS family arabinose efflux permease
MRLGLFLTGAGMLILATGGSMPVLIIGMVIWGVGQVGYTPSIQAYLSSKLPYEKRSRFLGILEYSWALAGILGLSLMGVLIEWFGWRVPLYVLGGGLLLASAVFRMLPMVESGEKQPPDEEEMRGHGSEKKEPQGDRKDVEVPLFCRDGARLWAGRVRRFFYLGAHQGSAWGAVVLNFFNFFAMFHIMIIHGGWLEQSYGLRASQLGGVALLLGIFDWSASILVSLFGDRIGKRRSVTLGITGIALSSALLPLLDFGIAGALFALVLVRFSFEFTTVSNFPLLSEQFPEKRGKVMSFSLAGGLMGSTIAATTGPAAFFRFGVWGLGPVSLSAALMSLLLIRRVVREAPHSTDASEHGASGEIGDGR